MFPVHISMLDNLRSEEMIKFKTEFVDGHEFTIVSYMISSPGLWALPNAVECRGITYDANGDCVCAPFHKFFNVGEREDMLPQNLPWDTMSTVMEKRDGSMLTPVLVNDKIFWKTKKSFVSDVALLAAKHASAEILEFSKNCIESGWTPIFEFTSVQSEIVLNYGDKPAFVLLALRNMKSGVYMSYNVMRIHAEANNIAFIKQFEVTYEEMAEQMKALEDFEGYVLRFDDSNGKTMLAKIKTEWYCRMHRAKTDLRVRDVADMCVDETLDDVKATVTQAGLSLDLIEEIERQVAAEMADTVHRVKLLLAEAVKLPDRKSIAMAYRDHELFGLMMKEFENKEPNYNKYWVDHYRSAYPLHNVFKSFVEDDA